MYVQVEKKSRAVANSVSQKKSNGKQGFGFVDNRPEAVGQSKLLDRKSTLSNVVQRTIWVWDSSKGFWLPEKTEGQPTPQPGVKGKKHGERVSTGAEHLMGAFTSLNTDEANGYYKVTTAPEPKINVSPLEKDFSGQSGKSIKEAVQEAIDGLEIDGSSPSAYSRHDFQPAGANVENLQIQLGGSKLNYRVGKGDTSCTLVLVDATLFKSMAAKDAGRWKKVLQAAHELSYSKGVKVTIQ